MFACPGLIAGKQAPAVQGVVELLVPALQRRGRYPLGYRDGTLRHKLFGKGDRLPEAHAGQQVRIQ